MIPAEFTLPAHVARVVDELTLDPTVLEVWLIGSRPSGTATSNSDWDVLVRSTVEPIQRAARADGVDVLRCGPKTALLEGMTENFAFAFSDFRWHETSEGIAEYCGRRFIDVGVEPHDTSAQVQEWVKCKGIRLWKRQGREQG